jgi:hypothetical protein
MKAYFNLNSLDAPSSHAAHKAIQNRTHNNKTTSHRHERRKVREILRHGDGSNDQ